MSKYFSFCFPGMCDEEWSNSSCSKFSLTLFLYCKQLFVICEYVLDIASVNRKFYYMCISLLYFKNARQTIYRFGE